MAASAQWAATLDGFARMALAASGAPGLAVAVARGGVLVYAHGFGVRDAERGLPVTPTTVFGAGSIGKVVTALAVMQLVEAGALRLTDPVVRYLPSFRVPDEGATAAITIHHLLTHTSGLPPLPVLLLAYLGTDIDPAERAELAPFIARFSTLPTIHCYDDLLGYLASQPYELVGFPGERFSYSNEGYSLLGAILEQVTGRPFEDYVSTQIFDPAGMRRSTLRADRLAALGNVTKVYRRDTSGMVCPSPTWFNPSTAAPAGLLGTTARDLVQFMEMLRRHGLAGQARLISTAGAAAMTTPHSTFLDPIQYGYGLQIQQGYHGVTLIGHGGGAKGMAAYAGYVPELGLTAAVLSNLAAVPSEAIWLAAVNLELGLAAETPRVVRPPVTLAPAALRRLAGRYAASEQETIEITVAGSSLLYHDALYQVRLTPVGEQWAIMEVAGRPLEVEFIAGDDGAIRALAVRARVYRRIA